MKIGIIGGGAAGMAAAIAAAENNAAVTILEKNDRIGKKLLATGNGKCNFSNLQFTCGCYRSDDPQRLKPILEQFTVSDTVDFFHRLGLMTKEKNGYLYPACEQASAVLDVLRFALARRKVRIETGCRVIKTEKKGPHFLVHTQKDNRHILYEFDKIILACGSSAGLKRETEENGMKLAGLFSLERIPFSPALVQLRCGEDFFRALAGVRCQAAVTLHADGAVITETGELQLTDYGISGIPVFQLSRYAAKSFAKGRKQLAASIDFLPGIKEAEWEKLLLTRRQTLGFETAEQFFTGTVHKKIAGVVLKQCRIPFTEITDRLADQTLLLAGRMCKAFPVTVTGVNSFAQAQVCAGGVRLTEVTDSMEAKKQKGLYLAGELLDADGRCGGYNLQWAWTTGTIAGRAASIDGEIK